mgnify:CR=1 FL=1
MLLADDQALNVARDQRIVTDTRTVLNRLSTVNIALDELIRELTEQGDDLARVIKAARRIRNGQPLRTQDLETSAARHTVHNEDLREWPAMRALCRKLCLPA